MHSRASSAIFKSGIWLNLCIDVKGIFEAFYPDDNFKQIDGILLKAYCKCRKIFAVRRPIIDTSELDLHSVEIPVVDYTPEDLPKNL